MGLKDYAKKKILTKVGEVATMNAVIKTANHIDKKNEENSLSEKEKKGKNENMSSKSFFEQPTINKLIMTQKIVALRRSYMITDSAGNVLYTAKSDGLPKMPEMGLYKDGDKIGRAEKGIMGNPMYTLHYMNRRIASLHQKYSFKPKYEIPENGWSMEGGMSKTTVYDGSGDIAIQIQYMLTSSKGTVIVEYTNRENEIPALLIAMAMILAYHMS